MKPQEYTIIYNVDNKQECHHRMYYKWFPFLSWKKPIEENTDFIPVVEIQEDTLKQDKLMFQDPEYQI